MATFEQAVGDSTVGSDDRADMPITADTATAPTTDLERAVETRTTTIVGTTADTDRPQPTRAVDIAGDQTQNRARPCPKRLSTEAERFVESGILIPGAFRGVEVVVVDPDGEPLENVDWVMSAGVFPTAAPVDDSGRATLPLLQTSYTEFQGIAEREGRPRNVKYSWFNPATDGDGNRLQEPISPRDETGIIVLDPVEIKGMYAGKGVDMGGLLQ
ncbi:hypothetical protein [Natrinema sp. HArc-T2]|uniref:hypothetical protein n=1 Tax=Natrinema sp. HArc-T2 TaxID=3242701 RepID=UPI00359DA8D3